MSARQEGGDITDRYTRRLGFHIQMNEKASLANFGESILCKAQSSGDKPWGRGVCLFPSHPSKIRHEKLSYF